MSNTVFAYGLLQHREVLQQLFKGLPGESGTLENMCFTAAVLSGFARRTLQFDQYPPCAVAVEDSAAVIEGVLLSGVTDSQLKVMDAFEMLEEGIYVRSTLPVQISTQDTVSAEVYLAGPAIHGASIGGEWNEADFMSRYFRTYVEKVVPEFAEESRS